jgi:hypothetical protein
MRWPLLKKALVLAKESLRRPDIWVDFPPRLGVAGEITIFCQDNMEPLGEIHYQQKTRGAKTVVRFSIGDKIAEVDFPRSKRVTIRSRGPMEELRPILMNHGEAGFKILADAAKMKLTSDESIVKWAIDGGLTSEEANRIVSYANPKSERKEKKEYERSDRVRIIGPCMDFGELAWVVGIQKNKKGTFYEVLVDGSSKPIFVPPEWLKENEAGVTPNA